MNVSTPVNAQLNLINFLIVVSLMSRVWVEILLICWRLKRTVEYR